MEVLVLVIRTSWSILVSFSSEHLNDDGDDDDDADADADADADDDDCWHRMLALQLAGCAAESTEESGTRLGSTHQMGSW